MRISIILLLIGILQVHAGDAYSQKLSLSFTNTELIQVLDQIEQESEYYFLYNEKLLDTQRKVSITENDKQLSIILDKLFAGTNVKYTIVDRKIILAPEYISAQSLQQSRVTGTVTDGGTGEPLAGVTIQVKGTMTGAISGADGEYSVNIPQGSTTLIFSFIGYTSQEIDITGRATVDVILAEEATALQEVVVTGYSVERKKDIIGSVSVVNTDEMLSTPSGNLGTQLQGRVSGITVSADGSMGSTAKVRIRGFGSFGGSDPLYIIDGVPGDIDKINPNDIESVQVLKDAASASVYGARAANGVVIVTTRQGKAGKIQVSLDSYYGVNYVNKNRLTDLLDAQEYGEMYWKAMQGAGRQYGDANWYHPQYGTGATPVIPEYLLAGDRFGTQIEALRTSDPALFQSLTNPENYNQATHPIVKSANTDWFDEVFRSAPIQNHQITVSGGSDRAVFALGMNYFDQKNTADKYSYFTRYTLRANSSFTVNKFLRIGENLQIGYTESRDVDNPQAVYCIPSLLPVYDIMGNPAGSAVKGLVDIQTSEGRNPVTDPWRNRFDGNDLQTIFGNGFFEITPINGLILKSNFGYNFSVSENKNLQQITYEYAANDTYNSLTWSYSKGNSWVWTNTANYTKTIGSHTFKVLFGTEAIKDLSRNVSATRLNYAIEDFPPYLVIDAGTGAQTNSGRYTRTTLFSLFGRIDYSFADKYILNATLRRDGSSKFGENNRFGYFPAAAIGWRLSGEEFMKNLTWLTDLKLRASYGIIGNQSGLSAENQFSTFTSDIAQSYQINGVSGIGMSATTNRLGNPDARWEKSITTNLGFDASLFSGRLLMNLDYFIRETEDLLVINQAPHTGPSSTQPSVNVGNVKNSGIDITVTNRGQIFGEIDFEISANFSQYNNEATKILDNPAATLRGASSRLGAITLTQKGYPISFFWGYITDGFFNTQEEVDDYMSQVSTTWIPPKVGRWRIKDVSGPDGVPDNVINQYDRTYIGDPHPDFQVGLNLMLAYKNFDLNCFIFWNQGGEIFNQNKYNIDFNTFAYQRSARMLYDSWTPENNEALLPALDINDSYSNLYATNYYVEDATYVRLKNLQIGYTLPSSLLNKINVSKFRIYLQGQNLLTFVNKEFTGMDPGLNISGGDLSMGVIDSQTPTPQQLILGVNIGF